MFKVFNAKVDGVTGALCCPGYAISYLDENDCISKFARIPCDSELDIGIGDMVKIVSSDELSCGGYRAVVIEVV